MAAELPDLSLFTFSHRLRVRWAEADMQGVVFNGHYLTFFDIGITEYLRAAFANDPEAMAPLYASLYVAQSSLNFRASARFDDLIDVRVRTAHLGNSSMKIEFAITRDDELLVDGVSIYVYAPDTTPARVPDAVREALTKVDTAAS